MTSSSSLLAGIRGVTMIVTVSLLTAAGCSGTNVPSGFDPVASASAVVTVPARIGREGCDPASPIVAVEGGLEVGGNVDRHREELWAMFSTDRLVAGGPIDVHWRIGGDGSMRVTLVGPNELVAPAPAPRPEAYSGWDRPGEPWFGTITFPQAGCWRVHVQRARIQGEIWVEVD